MLKSGFSGRVFEKDTPVASGLRSSKSGRSAGCWFLSQLPNVSATKTGRIPATRFPLLADRFSLPTTRQVACGIDLEQLLLPGSAHDMSSRLQRLAVSEQREAGSRLFSVTSAERHQHDGEHHYARPTGFAHLSQPPFRLPTKST